MLQKSEGNKQDQKESEILKIAILYLLNLVPITWLVFSVPHILGLIWSQTHQLNYQQQSTCYCSHCIHCFIFTTGHKSAEYTDQFHALGSQYLIGLQNLQFMLWFYNNSFILKQGWSSVYINKRWWWEQVTKQVRQLSQTISRCWWKCGVKIDVQMDT
jgi:hypothetical protein